MKRILISMLFILSMSIFFLSCNSGSDDQKEPQAEFIASFEGDFSNYGTSSYMTGNVTITQNVITMEFFGGRMVGTATKLEDGYTFTITQAYGVFDNIENLSGEISSEAQTLAVEGENLDGSDVSINGNIKIMTTAGWENLAKSRVIFAHYDINRTATVSINGVSHSGMNAHYDGEDYCTQLNSWTHIPGNYDVFEKTSGISCYTGTLKGLDGNPVTFTDCSTIYYILDKNKTYTYTVTWSDGETYTKEFTTAGGGGTVPICLSGNGGGGGGNSGQFSLNGVTYTTGSYNWECSAACPETTCVNLQTADENNNIAFYNIPTASSGTFQIQPYPIGGAVNCQLVGFAHINMNTGTYEGYNSLGGTLTKTGPRSYTFTCTLFKGDNQSDTYVATGHGTY